jgi:hypothetical protein
MALRDGATSAARVGILPSWLMLAGLAVAWGVAVAVSRVRRDHAWPLFVPLVTVLPWCPVPVSPSILIWIGPMTGAVWALALAAFLVARSADGLPGPSRRPWNDPAVAPWVACLLALAVYVGAGWRISPMVPGGDEPHYLIISQSLLRDGDLRIENNHTRGDYLSYFGGQLKPDYLRRGTDGEIYSIHLPGVSVLVAPALAIGGYPLVKVWLALLAAMASMVMWRAAYALAGSAAGAWFAWAGVSITAPFLFLAFTAYPDGPGSVIVAIVFGAIVSLRSRTGRSLLWWGSLGLGLSALPWLHGRFSAIAGMLGLVLVARAWGERRRLASIAALLVCPLASAAGWFGYYYLIYGTPNPSAPYGHYTQMSAGSVWRGLTGVLFDQQFGLVAAAPVFVLAVVGIAALLREDRRLGLEWLAVVVPYTVVSSMYHMWWGGHSSPARFLGSLMLVCAIPLAAAWKAGPHPATRTLQLSLLALSLTMAGMFAWVDRGQLVFNVRDGLALWAVWASRGADIASGLPSVFRTPTATALCAAMTWLAVSAAAWGVVRLWAEWKRPSVGAVACVTALALLLACSISMTASWRLEGVSGVSATNGQLALLNRAASAPGDVGLSLGPIRLAPPREVATRVHVDGTSSSGRPAWAVAWVPRLPAGRYQLSFDNRVADAAFDLGVVIGRGDTPVDVWHFEHLAPGRVSRGIELPRAVRSIAWRGDTAWRSRLGDIRVDVLQVGESDNGSAGRVTMARRYNGALVMGVGEDVFLEPSGVWARAETRAEVVIEVPAGQLSQRVLLRAGPVLTGVDLAAGGWRQHATLQPGGTQIVDIPTGSSSAITLSVKTNAGFRPSQTEPGSTDSRYLGVWLEFLP